MKKIVRGKIKSIDAMVGKKETSLEGEEIEILEYRITLENDSNEYIARSIIDFKEGSVVDICFDENKKNKNNTKKGIIINNKVSNKLLDQLNTIKIGRWISYLFLLGMSVFLLPHVTMNSSSYIAFSIIGFIYVIFILCMEGSYNEIKLSKEDIKVLKQYKKDFKIENEESLDKVKQVQVI